MSSWTCEWPQPKLHGKCCISTCLAEVYVCRHHNPTWCLRAQGCRTKKEWLYCPNHSKDMQYEFKSLEDMEWYVSCLGQHEPARTPGGYRALGPSPPKGISGGDSSSWDPSTWGGGDPSTSHSSTWDACSWGASSRAWGATDNTQADVAQPPPPAPRAFPEAIPPPAPPKGPPPPVKAVQSTPPMALTDAQPAITEGTSAASAGPSAASPSALEPPAWTIGVNSGNLWLGSADPRDHVLQGAIDRIAVLEAVVQQVPCLHVTLSGLNHVLAGLEAQVSSTSTRLERLEAQVSSTSTVGTGLDLMRSPSAFQSGAPATGPPGSTAMTAATPCPSEIATSDAGDPGDVTGS